MFQTKAVISCREPISFLMVYVGLTQFRPKNNFIGIYCQQVTVTGSFESLLIWPVSAATIQNYFFPLNSSALLRLISG